MALELVEVSEILDDMQRRFWRDINSGTRTFRDRVMKRRNLVHNLETEWQLTGPLAKLPQFHSDAARKRWFELRSRICENHFVVRSEPLRNSPTLRTASNDFESVMNTGIALVEERNGYILQEALADGQIVDGLGILHWRKADEIYPAFPEAVEMDTAPSMEERDRYRRRRTDSGSYRWIESAESVAERRNEQMAKAGFPWHIEVCDAMQTMWVGDTFSDHALVATVVEVPVLRYLQARMEEDIALSIVESEGKLRLYRERGTIPEWSERGATDRMIVATVWDRENFYEMAAVSATGGLGLGMAWEMVKSSKHPYGLPPFAFCPGQYVPNRPPELAYLPALEGMFQMKDTYDRSMTLMLGMQEQSAVRKWWIERQGEGEGLLDEGGERISITSDSASADMLPLGAVLRNVNTEVTPGFVDSVKAIQQAFMDAAPQTGQAEYSESTQPWTMRLATQQANVEPRMYISHQVRALNAMCRSMAKVMAAPADEGGFGEPIAVMSGGTGRNRVVIAVEPEQIMSLDVQVDIDATSMQERIAAVEHGRALLNDPMVPVSTIDFLEDYMKEPDPDHKYAEYKAWELFETNVLPMVLKQELGKQMAKEFVLGPNGEFVGQGGQEATPEQVLAANGAPATPGGGFPLMSPETGGETAPPRPGPGGPPQPPNLAQGANAPIMPGPGVLAVPNTMPLR